MSLAAAGKDEEMIKKEEAQKDELSWPWGKNKDKGKVRLLIRFPEQNVRYGWTLHKHTVTRIDLSSCKPVFLVFPYFWLTTIITT